MCVHRLSRRFVAPLIVLFGVFLVAPSSGQQPPPANAAAPTITPLVPLGMPRGGTLELTVTGTNLAGATGVWTGIPGAKATIPTDGNNGKDATKLRVKLEVPPSAPLGFYPVRIANARGISNLRLFCVDDLPQMMEVDTNRTKTTAQAVPVPGVVVGRVDAEATDYFKVTVRAGQRVSFEVLGRRLGSALDPVLSILEPRTGRVLIHSEDAPGLQSDPRLTYTFKDAGEYLVEIRDTMYRGGADYYYRLRMGDFPCATTPFPLSGKRGSKATIGFAGPTVEGVAPSEIVTPSDPQRNTLPVAPRGASGLHGWPVLMTVSDLDQVMEKEPNNDPTKATRVPVPCGISGRFAEKNDIDHYVFNAKKGQRLIVEARTLELSSPTEVYMVLKDAKGGQVAVTNPMAAPRLDFTAAGDGDYTLAVEHLHLWSGPSESYHISVAPYQPGFDLSTPSDRLDVAQGGTVSIPLVAARRDYTGPIEVSVVSPPGFTGTVTLTPAAGKPDKPGTPSGQLVVTVPVDMPLGPQVLRLVGKASINGQTVTAPVLTTAPVKAALAGLPFPPPELSEVVGVAVTARPPFVLALKFDAAENLRGGPAMATVTATRIPGFTEEIALSAGALPANVTGAFKPIPKGANEVKFPFTPAAAAALGSLPVTVTGKAKVGTETISVTSSPAPLVVVVPFELKAEPAPLKIVPGAKATLKVTATRKAGYMGPIALEVRNLPANVSAAKGTIAMGQTTGEIEVMAAANAAAGDKTDVNILGTASSAPGNPTQASPNLTLSVGKK